MRRTVARRSTTLLGSMLMTIASTHALSAQSPPSTPAPEARIAAELGAAFATVGRHLLAAAAMVPEEKYASRPVEGIRTFLQLVAHVADGNDYYCRLAAGEEVEWAERAERSAATKAEAIAELERSVRACADAYRTAGARTAPLVDGLAHASLHYGNVVVYLRSMGLTPPSS